MGLTPLLALLQWPQSGILSVDLEDRGPTRLSQPGVSNAVRYRLWSWFLLLIATWQNSVPTRSRANRWLSISDDLNFETSLVVVCAVEFIILVLINDDIIWLFQKCGPDVKVCPTNVCSFVFWFTELKTLVNSSFYHLSFITKPTFPFLLLGTLAC